MPRWKSETRKKQATLCKANKPWLKSTGPKTKLGKQRSSKNSQKYGLYTVELLTMKKILLKQRKWLKKLCSDLNLKASFYTF